MVVFVVLINCSERNISQNFTGQQDHPVWVIDTEKAEYCEVGMVSSSISATLFSTCKQIHFFPFVKKKEKIKKKKKMTMKKKKVNDNKRKKKNKSCNKFSTSTSTCAP